MDLHLTGSEGELLFCSTPCLNVTIKGVDISSPLVSYKEKESSLRIVCDDDFNVTLSGDSEMVFSQYLGRAYSSEFHSIPVFFEQKRYELIVEPAEGHKVEFWHENYHVRNKLSPVGRNHHLLTGVIGFGNDIGPVLFHQIKLQFHILRIFDHRTENKSRLALGMCLTLQQSVDRPVDPVQQNLSMLRSTLRIGISL